MKKDGKIYCDFCVQCSDKKAIVISSPEETEHICDDCVFISMKVVIEKADEVRKTIPFTHS